MAAHLTFYRDEAYKTGRRFIGIERVGEVAGDMRITTRKLDVEDSGLSVGEALELFLQEWGLTVVEEPRQVGPSLQVGVR